MTYMPSLTAAAFYIRDKSGNGVVPDIGAEYPGQEGEGGAVSAEDIDDRVAALLQEGPGIDLSYDDAANTLQISSTATAADAANTAYTRAGAGAVPWTVKGRLDTTVNVLDFMSAAQRTDVLSYTGALELTAAVRAAYAVLSASGGALYFPAGRYRFDFNGASIATPKLILDIQKPNVELAGDGDATVMYMANVSTASLNADPGTDFSGENIATVFGFTSVEGGGVRDMRFVGDHNVAADAAVVVLKPRAQGIGVKNCQGIYIRGVSGKGIPGNVINLRGNTGTRETSTYNCAVVECRADGCGENGMNAMGGTFACIFLGCISNGNEYHGFEFGTADLMCGNCAADRNQRYAISQVGERGVIENCTGNGNKLGGIHLQWNSAQYNGSYNKIVNCEMVCVDVSAYPFAVDNNVSYFELSGGLYKAPDGGHAAYINPANIAPGCNRWKIRGAEFVIEGITGEVVTISAPSTIWSFEGNIVRGGAVGLRTLYSLAGGVADYLPSSADLRSTLFSIIGNQFDDQAADCFILTGVKGIIRDNILNPKSSAARLGQITRLAHSTVRANRSGSDIGHVLAPQGLDFNVAFDGSVTLTTASGLASFTPNGDIEPEVFHITLGINTTINAPVNLRVGREYTFVLRQNATGGFTVTWNAAYSFPIAAFSATGNVANAVSVQRFVATSVSAMRQSSPQVAYAV